MYELEGVLRVSNGFLCRSIEKKHGVTAEASVAGE